MAKRERGSRVGIEQMGYVFGVQILNIKEAYFSENLAQKEIG